MIEDLNPAEPVGFCVRCRWLGVGTNARGRFRYYCELQSEDLGDSVLGHKACSEAEPCSPAGQKR